MLLLFQRDAVIATAQKGKGMKFSKTKWQKKTFWHHMHEKGVKILGLPHSKTEPAPVLCPCWHWDSRTSIYSGFKDLEMTPGCTRRGLDQVSGIGFSQKGLSSIGKDCAGSGGVTMPASAQITSGWGTWGHSLVVTVVVLCWWWDLII